MIARRPDHIILWTVLLAMLALGGCGSSTGKFTPADPQAGKLAAYKGKVLILGGPLPAEIRHDVLGEIEVVKQHGYGSTAQANRMLADKAREVGANAVIDARVWLSPVILGSKVAPHGRGVAVRVRDTKSLEELSKKGGRWE